MSATWEPPFPHRWYVAALLAVDSLSAGIHFRSGIYLTAGTITACVIFIVAISLRFGVAPLTRGFYGFMAGLYASLCLAGISRFWSVKFSTATAVVLLACDAFMFTFSIVQRYGLPKPPAKLVRKVSWTPLS